MGRKNQQNKERRVGLGIALGVSIGSLNGYMALSTAIGVVVGISLAAVFDFFQRKKNH